MKVGTCVTAGCLLGVVECPFDSEYLRGKGVVSVQKNGGEHWTLGVLALFLGATVVLLIR